MPSDATHITADAPVAIIGMACFFPAADGLKGYWRLLSRGIDAIGEVPPSHWAPEDFFDADPRRPDHVYCKRGGFLAPVPFDPSEFGIPPASLEATDTSQILGLVAAKKALEDAGYGGDRPFDRSRTSVVLGVTGTQELVIPLGARLGHPIWRRALVQSGVAPQQTEEVIRRISDAYVPWQENSFPGLLGNVVAGRISNRLDLSGTNCVVDAACASSMSALHLALLELASGQSDMVITGGVDTINDIFMHMCFAKTHILSPTGDARPFSEAADGTVLGEGVGLMVLKRLADAERDGDRIYALIRGMGASSDGRSQSIYAPHPEGQAKALRSAYSRAAVDPASVGLVEAHGTGTLVGDEVEFKALKQVFGGGLNAGAKRCAIGSVKSMIGHTKAAAGAAGLIKAALSLHHKVLPPTLKAERPAPRLEMERSPFYLNTRTRPWLSLPQTPRRCGVSAFGFGGSNFHVVMEEYRPAKEAVAWDGSVDIVAFSAPDEDSLVREMAEFSARVRRSPSPSLAAESRRRFSAAHNHRLVLTVDGPLDRPSAWETSVLALADRISAGGPAALAAAAADEAVSYGSGPPEGKTAFIFPGQGSQYRNMGRDLVCCFPEAFAALQCFEAAFAAGDTGSASLAEWIYPVAAVADGLGEPAGGGLNSTEVAQPATGAVSMAMARVLRRFGVLPDMVCGHSYGELAALWAAGWIDDEVFATLSVARGRLMAAVGHGDNGPRGAMLAVSAPLEEVAALMADISPELILANRNSPLQGVLSGPTAAIEEALRVCRRKSLRATRLPVSAAFHTPMMSGACAPFLQALQAVRIRPADVPVFANTTGRPYPRDAEQARRLLAEHLLQPVNFVTEIENLYQSGARVFIEVGPKAVLTGLIGATLADRPVLACPLDPGAGKNFGLRDLAQVLGRLAARGIAVDLCAWEDTPTAERVPRMKILVSGANIRRLQPSSAPVPSPAVKTDAESRRAPVTPSEPDDAPMALHPQSQTVTQAATHRQQDNMDKNDKIEAAVSGGFLSQALQAVAEGLKTLQAMQLQTAEAHRKFLESQTEASRAVQEMVRQTQHLAEGAAGRDVTIPSPLDADPAWQPPPVAPPRRLSQAPLSPPQATSDGGIPDVAISPAPGDSQPEAAEKRDVSPDIEQALLEVVGELTGYPVETLGLDMDIEADLGIDSIKRVEILSSLEERLPGLPAVAPEDLGDLKTLEQIVAYLCSAETVSAPWGESDSPVDEISVENEEKTVSKINEHNVSDEVTSDAICGTIQRLTVSLEALPAVGGEVLKIPKGRKVFVTDDRSGLSQAIVDALGEMGVNTVLISPDILRHRESLPSPGGLIVVQAPDDDATRASLAEAFGLTRHVASGLLQSAAAGGAVFAAVTRMDGGFGFGDGELRAPLQGGLGGLVKTAALEWPAVRCRAVDVAPDWRDDAQIAKAVLAEVFDPAPDGPLEVGLTPAGRKGLNLVPAPYPSGVRLRPALGADDVIVVSGGARGVTADAALELARSAGPTLVLLGRAPEPRPEPAWLEPLEDSAAVKQAIVANEFAERVPIPKEIEASFSRHMANRDISRNLERLRAAGARAMYVSVDVRDAQQVAQVFEKIRASYGPVSGIVHGAGVLEDRLIVDKSDAQFEAVFDTKVEGLSALLAAAGDDPLRYLVLFSSVSARLGNQGQADYAMANEALNKLARREAAVRPGCRVVSINWGPWDGGMVDGTLKREFERRGIDLIPSSLGPLCMLYEMAAEPAGPVEVVVGGRLTTAATVPRTPADVPPLPPRLTFTREIDLHNHPILAAHCLDNTPVVPLALITEWFGHGALHENPGLVFHGLDGMRVLNGLRLETERKVIRMLAGRARRRGTLYEVDLELRDGALEGVDRLHSRATAILADELAVPPDPPAAADVDGGSYPRSLDEVYEKILFHGGHLQGLREVIHFSPQLMVARVASAPAPREWVIEPLRSRWITDPLVLDSAFQMASLWCFEQTGSVSLPSYAASYRQYCAAFPGEDVRVVMEIRASSPRRMRADFTFLDSQGRVLARLTGYEAVMDTSLMRAFKPQIAANA